MVSKGSTELDIAALEFFTGIMLKKETKSITDYKN